MGVDRTEAQVKRTPDAPPPWDDGEGYGQLNILAKGKRQLATTGRQFLCASPGDRWRPLATAGDLATAGYLATAGNLATAGDTPRDPHVTLGPLGTPIYPPRTPGPWTLQNLVVGFWSFGG